MLLSQTLASVASDSQSKMPTPESACLSPTLALICHAVNNGKPKYAVMQGVCAGPSVCPLSQVKAGTVVCIKQLDTAPDVTERLREMGLGEEQRIRLVSRHSNLICQVCNARLGISKKLADSILVETVPAAAALH